MTVHVVAEFPLTESGAKDMIEGSVSDDGFVVTGSTRGTRTSSSSWLKTIRPSF